jgi:hypothetical protein
MDNNFAMLTRKDGVTIASWNFKEVQPGQELCCATEPELWAEFCKLTKREIYYSDVWTVDDVRNFIEGA